VGHRSSAIGIFILGITLDVGGLHLSIFITYNGQDSLHAYCLSLYASTHRGRSSSLIIVNFSKKKPNNHFWWPSAVFTVLFGLEQFVF
jgi:hypothetical protein